LLISAALEIQTVYHWICIKRYRKLWYKYAKLFLYG
jgi:hypothetical protein